MTIIMYILREDIPPNFTLEDEDTILKSTYETKESAV